MRSKTAAFIVLIAVSALLFLGTLELATHGCASAFRHHPALGGTSLFGMRWYVPWAWLLWAAQAEGRAPRVFAQAEAITFTGGAITFALLLVAAVKLRGAPPSTAHGSARWATRAELKAAGLLDDAGVVLCQTADAKFSATGDGRGGRAWKLLRPARLVRHAGPEHVLVFAPTRSGKGIGTVVPTLLSWQDSVIVYDIKKELWDLTAGWRRRFTRCWRFEPTGTDGVRFNPLAEVRKGTGEVRDVQNIAEILIDPEGKGERDHWRISGAALLTGVILHVLYAERDKTLRGVVGFLSDPSRAQVDTLERMLATSHLPTGPHPVVAQTARAMLSKSENELSGVVSTALAALTLYADPLVCANTEGSDFRIADLMNGDHPVSLYLVVPPSDLVRTRPLIRLLLQQIGTRLTERMNAQEPLYRHRLLMLLDEFPSLGRLAFFESALAFSAGYGIKCFLICQSLNQLEAAYGRHNAIVDNCHVRMAYAANTAETAKTVSDLLGLSTAAKKQRSVSGKGLLGGRSTSESDQEFGRPLMTPDEITRLPYDDAVVFIGGFAPYRGRKLMYYLDDRFVRRAGLPPPNSAVEQQRELPPRTPLEWEGYVVAPSPLVTADRPFAEAAATFDEPLGTAPQLAATATAPVADASFSDEWAKLLGADETSSAATEPGADDRPPSDGPPL